MQGSGRRPDPFAPHDQPVDALSRRGAHVLAIDQHLVAGLEGRARFARIERGIQATGGVAHRFAVGHAPAPGTACRPGAAARAGCARRARPARGRDASRPSRTARSATRRERRLRVRAAWPARRRCRDGAHALPAAGPRRRRSPAPRSRGSRARPCRGPRRSRCRPSGRARSTARAARTCRPAAAAPTSRRRSARHRARRRGGWCCPSCSGSGQRPDPEDGEPRRVAISGSTLPASSRLRSGSTAVSGMTSLIVARQRSVRRW